MKKLILLCLIILSLLLQVSCGQGEVSKVVTSPYPTEGRETKLVPDESLTGELTVSLFRKDYSKADGYQTGDQITATSKKFSELYPNVKLTVERGSDSPTLKYEDYCAKLSTEIMAGDGPDLFQVAGGMDANKMMRSGKLADLRDYFENDKSFNIADYNEVVFSGGQPEGKQFVVPTSYFISAFMSTKEALQTAGFDESKFKTFDGATAELDKLLKNVDEGKTRESLWKAPFFIIDPTVFVAPNFIDFDNQKVDLSSQKLKTVLKLAKNYFSDYLESPVYQGWSGDTSIPLEWKNNKSVLVEYNINAFNEVLTTARLVEKQEQTPVIFALQNENGGITASSTECYAVRASSPNIQQAYNFLKILINPEIQTTEYYKSAQIPISNKSADIFFERFKGELDGQYYGGDLGMVDLPPVSEEFIKSYKELINDIDCIFYSTGDINQVFREGMMPYYKGEKDYEECIKNAQSALEIYVSE